MINNTILTVYSLWQREIVRFYRQPSRILGAIGSPILFWILIGSGIGTSFQDPTGGSQTYLQYFFPGTLFLIVLFTAVFSTISIIEDRREGFLQAVLVAPVPRYSIVLGKILGGATLAFLQALLFLMLFPFLGFHLSAGQVVWTCAILFIASVGLTGLGFILAWQMNSIQGFHAVMNLLLIPLWLLSGALFPAEGAFGWIHQIMRWNPLSYELELLRHAMIPLENGALFSDLFSWMCTISFTLAVLLASFYLASKRTSEHLV